MITAHPCVRLSYSPHRCRAGERHCPPDNRRKNYKAATQGTGGICVKLYETIRLPVTPSAAVRRRARTRKGYATSVRLLRRQQLCRRPQCAVQELPIPYKLTTMSLRGATRRGNPAQELPTPCKVVHANRPPLTRQGTPSRRALRWAAINGCSARHP